jgi:hypothetical protein
MHSRTDYEADILAWAERQASVLRDLARTRRDLPNELDLDNVAEEIESVGRSQLAAVQSFLRQILIHLIKAMSARDPKLVIHWRKEVVAFHANIFDHLTPSMVDRIDLDRTWSQALRVAEAELAAYDQTLAAGLPRQCPLTIDEIFDPQFDSDRGVDVILASSRPAEERN